MDRHDDLAVALTPLIDVLERLGVAWHVGGSVASAVHGRFRATNDVDVIAELREEHASPIRAALEADHYVDEESIRDAARHRSSFNQHTVQRDIATTVHLSRSGDIVQRHRP